MRRLALLLILTVATLPLSAACSHEDGKISALAPSALAGRCNSDRLSMRTHPGRT